MKWDEDKDLDPFDGCFCCSCSSHLGPIEGEDSMIVKDFDLKKVGGVHSLS